MIASIKEFGFKVPVGRRATGRLKLLITRWKAPKTTTVLCLLDEWLDAQVKAFRLLVIDRSTGHLG
jgi:hypothetical protein